MRGSWLDYYPTHRATVDKWSDARVEAWLKQNDNPDVPGQYTGRDRAAYIMARRHAEAA